MTAFAQGQFIIDPELLHFIRRNNRVLALAVRTRHIWDNANKRIHPDIFIKTDGTLHDDFNQAILNNEYFKYFASVTFAQDFRVRHGGKNVVFSGDFIL